MTANTMNSTLWIVHTHPYRIQDSQTQSRQTTIYKQKKDLKIEHLKTKKRFLSCKNIIDVLLKQTVEGIPQLPEVESVNAFLKKFGRILVRKFKEKNARM